MNKFKVILISCFMLGFNLKSFCQLTSTNQDPESARIVYTDVVNFINAFNMLEHKSDTVEILQKYYIDIGTSGLKIFIEKYGLDATKLKKAIKKNPEDYGALQERLTWLKSQEDSIRSYFHKLQHFIPDAVYPPNVLLSRQKMGNRIRLY